jgi:hypothetical protein
MYRGGSNQYADRRLILSQDEHRLSVAAPRVLAKADISLFEYASFTMPCPNLEGGDEAARVHNACFAMAVRGTGATARTDPARRHPLARNRRRCGISDLDWGIRSGTGAVGLEHRPQPAYRHALGHIQCRRHSEIRLGNGRACSGRYPGSWRPTLAPLLQITRTVPTVFAAVTDPVGAGLVDSLARPSGNATGFMNFEYGIGAKWLELLKEIAPGVTRTAVPRDPTQGASTAMLAAIQAAAQPLSVEVNPVNMRDADEIERAIAAFARTPNGGLIVAAGGRTLLHRELIITLAARHKLPAMYSNQSFVAAGGLMSYGPDFVDQYRQAACYVDRILKGEKPADLPVQAPTKYELVINLNTAKALGLTVPQSNGLGPSLLCPSWVDYIIATRGYDFRKGQRIL